MCRTALLLLPWMLAACVQEAVHRPVSFRTRARMEALALGKAEFLERLKAGARPPQEPVVLPFNLEAGVPVIQGSFNGGKPLPMMLDTGASRTLIHAELAVERRVPVLRAEDATVQMQGVMGKEEGRIGLLTPLKLGTWELHGYPCLVRTFENRLRGGYRNVFPDSLLGFDVAADHCSHLTLDYRNRRVTFGTGRPYVPPKGRRTASTPFQIKKGVPFISLRSGKVGWEAIVDTGSFNGVEISEALAARLGVQDQGRAVKDLYLMSVGGTVSSSQIRMRTVKLPDLTLLGEKYRDVEVDIAPGPPRVGSHFLKDYRVTFDFRRKKLWLEW